jgi:hypothetical protein
MLCNAILKVLMSPLPQDMSHLTAINFRALIINSHNKNNKSPNVKFDVHGVVHLDILLL